MELLTDTYAHYSLSVAGYTYQGTASIREDYFDGWLGADANNDVLAEIITDEQLPISTSDLTDWALTPV